MRPPLAFFVLAAAATLLLTLAPGIDLWVSGLFYRPDAGFALGAALPVRIIYRSAPYVTGGVLVFIAACFAARLFGRTLLPGYGARAALFLLLALAIGPGLITNTLLKDHWGRARPSQVTEFGGSRQFTPAVLPAAQCARNCSFTSGHAALGFYFVSFAFLARTRRGRRRGQLAGLTLGTLYGLTRIAQGGHFLSDVVIAGLIVYATSWLVYQAVIVVPLPHEALRRLATAHYRLLLASALTALAIAASIRFLDRPIAEFFHGRSAGVDAVFGVISQFGVSTGWLIGAAGLWLALIAASRLPGWREAAPRLLAWSYLPLFFFAAIAVPGLLVDLLKTLFGRARPKLLFSAGEYAFSWGARHADFWSFPSGHAACAVSIAAALGSIWPRWRAAFIAFAVLVAASRVVITAHYLSDVVMSAFIAVVLVRYLRFVFAQSGIRLDEARDGALRQQAELPSWPVRLGLDRLYRRTALSDNP